MPDSALDEHPLYEQLGMTRAEYGSVIDILGREPTDAELAMYSVMWSEHCSYKSSRAHLGRLPTDAPWVVVGPGENAGVVDLGDGWLAALRIESHNHPSFVEPYQGAATGVGGILRDVFTMGARPIGLWNQIRFGPLDDPHSRYLFDGVVRGIAGYGNAVGVPTLGGEVAFGQSYAGNPLVNVMALGIMRKEQLVLGVAGAPGTRAVLLGAATGRDGIGGASVLASASFNEEATDMRPSVQVGDPFEEKKLIEACLELYDRGLVVGIQDLGAAGLSCATSEPAARSGTGMEVDLDAVHVRETEMSATELLISESQERMMAFVEPDLLDEVLGVAERWEIDASVIGEVQPGTALKVIHEGSAIVDIPAASLTEDAPRYDRQLAEPWWLENVWTNTLDLLADPDAGEVLLALLEHPSIGDPSWIYEQFDHMLFLNTVVGPGHDASVLRIKGTNKAMVVSTDGNGRHCYLDPRRGAALLVYEAVLNISLMGAKPLAVVDNLNFGNPEKSDVMWQFSETIDGLAEACSALDVPVVGGNVSFYNETDGVDIFPTPVVGVLGLVDPAPDHFPGLNRAEAGDVVMLLGPQHQPNLAGSLFERALHGHIGGRPTAPDAAMARQVNELARELAPKTKVLHDVSDGGLAVALAEICIHSGVGAAIGYQDWRSLFTEGPHRILAVVPPGQQTEIEEQAGRHGVPLSQLGAMGGDAIEMSGPKGVIAVPLQSAFDNWRRAIRRHME